ncbi:MAG: DedA family protein, partial [Chlamydiia bacterium]|nr:DedA family protein [Chlamydiia bacterium]
QLFVWVFLGCYLSDWEAYWVGRYLGRRLFSGKSWLAMRVPRRRLAQISVFYKRFGIWTLLIGRFIPFGVRNCLFMSAGIGRMNFAKFILFDGIACLTSNTTLFLLAYSFGKNYLKLYELVGLFNIALFACFVVALAVAAFVMWQRRHQRVARASDSASAL